MERIDGKMRNATKEITLDLRLEIVASPFPSSPLSPPPPSPP